MDTVEREERWVAICRKFYESGMTRKAFSEKRGIARSTLGYWLKRLPASASSAPASEFVAMGTVELGRTSTLRIRLGGEVVAELDLPADQAVIRDVLKAAASV